MHYQTVLTEGAYFVPQCLFLCNWIILDGSLFHSPSGLCLVYTPPCLFYRLISLFIIITSMFGWFSSFHFHFTMSIHLFSFFSHSTCLFLHHVSCPPGTSLPCQLCLFPYSRLFLSLRLSWAQSPAVAPALSPGLCLSLPVPQLLCLLALVLCLVSETGSGVWIGQVRAACLALCLSIWSLLSHRQTWAWPPHTASTYQLVHRNSLLTLSLYLVNVAMILFLRI